MTQTVAAFYSAMSGLSVTGVTRSFGYEPNQVATADLPALWVRRPASGLGISSSFASASNATSKERTLEVVIAIEAAGQEMVSAATSALVTMIDSLETALDTWDATRPGYVDYTIAEDNGIEAGGVAYWGIVATVTTRG